MQSFGGVLTTAYCLFLANLSVTQAYKVFVVTLNSEPFICQLFNRILSRNYLFSIVNLFVSIIHIFMVHLFVSTFSQNRSQQFQQFNYESFHCFVVISPSQTYMIYLEMTSIVTIQFTTCYCSFRSLKNKPVRFVLPSIKLQITTICREMVFRQYHTSHNMQEISLKSYWISKGWRLVGREEEKRGTCSLIMLCAYTNITMNTTILYNYNVPISKRYQKS